MGAGSDGASGDGNGQVGLACAGATNQSTLRCWAMKPPPAIVDESMIDQRAVELEVGDVLGKRQLCNGELVFDRPGLLLVDLGVERIADDALTFVLALDGSSTVEDSAICRPAKTLPL